MRGWDRLWPRTLWGVIWRGALIVLLALAGDAFWFEPSSIRVAHYRVILDGADTASLGNFKIAVIADLHAGSPYIDVAKIDRIVALTNAAKPDLIVMAGDYVIQSVIGGRHMPIEKIASLLRHLDAPLGVYAVIGNHDRWENAEHITQALSAVGITVLENRSVATHRDDRTIYLAGIGDYFTQASDPMRALASIPPGHRALCITHSPDVFPELPARCLLTIAGHTHGGQVDLPFVGRLIVPSKYGQRYAAGLYHEGEKYLFVSTGVGTSVLPVRFNVPPEISLLEISNRGN